MNKLYCLPIFIYLISLHSLQLIKRHIILKIDIQLNCLFADLEVVHQFVISDENFIVMVVV